MGLKPELTGRTRHRVQRIGGFIGFGGRDVMVLQYELKGYVIDWDGFGASGEDKTWWVDAKPEWVTEVAEAAIAAAKANETADAVRRGEY